MSSAQNSSRRTTRAGSQTSRSYTCSSSRNFTRPYDNSPRIRFEYKEDPDFRQTRKNLMSAKNFDGYDTQNLVSFYWKLRDHAYYCALRARYNDATEAERLLKYLKSELDLRGQPVAEPKQKSFVEEMIKEVCDEYEKKLQKFDDDTQHRLQKIDEKHKDEQKNFNNSWKSDKLRPFMIPSVKLRNMKIQEKNLNSSGEYAKAKEIHKEIKILEQEEHKKAQEDANKQYNDEVQKLVQKQAEEKAEIIKRRNYKRKLILSEFEQQKREIKAHGARNIPSAQEKRKLAKNNHFSNDFEPSKSKITREAEKRSKHLLPPIRPPMVHPGDWNSDKESEYSEDGDVCVPKQKKIKRIRANSQRIEHRSHKLLPENKKKDVFSKSLKLNNESSSNSYNDSDLFQNRGQMDSSRDEISSSTSIETDIPPITCSKIDAASTVAWETHWDSSSDDLLSDKENSHQSPAKNQISDSITVKNHENHNIFKSKMSQNSSLIQSHQTDSSQISNEKNSEKISQKSGISVGLPNNSDSQQLGFVVHKASSVYSPRSDQDSQIQSPSKGTMRISELNSPSNDIVEPFQAIHDKISTFEMINDSDSENKSLPISDIPYQSNIITTNANTSINIQNEINKMLNYDQNDSIPSDTSEYSLQHKKSIQDVTNLQISDKNNIFSEISEEERVEKTSDDTEIVLSPQKEQNLLNVEEKFNFDLNLIPNSENSVINQRNIPFTHDQIKDPIVLRSNHPNLPIIETKSNQTDPNIIELAKKLEDLNKTFGSDVKRCELVEIPPPNKSTAVILTKQVQTQRKLSFTTQVLADQKPSLKISDVTFYSGNYDILSENSEEEEEKTGKTLTIGGTFSQTAPDPVEPVVIDIGCEYEEEYEEEEQIIEDEMKNSKAKYVIQYNQRTPYFIFAPNNEVVYVDPQTARISSPISSARSTPPTPIQMDKNFGPNSTRYYD